MTRFNRNFEKIFRITIIGTFIGPSETMKPLIFFIFPLAMSLLGCGKSESDQRAEQRVIASMKAESAENLKQAQLRTWEKIGTFDSIFDGSKAFTIYVDPTSIEKHPKGLKAWTRWEYKNPQEWTTGLKVGKGSYLSYVSLEVINCTQIESGESEKILYAENDLKGNVVAELSSDIFNKGKLFREANLRMRSAIQDGPAYKLIKHVCQLAN